MATVDAVPAVEVTDADRGECAPAQIYGPAPSCVDDARCIEEHGTGWVCERGTYAVPDGCGGTIDWPTGACKPGPGAAPDAGAADAGAEPADASADVTPAELAQLVRDAVTRADARDVGSRAVPDYAAPNLEEAEVVYGLPMASATPRGLVRPAGLPQQVGGTGTVDLAVVRRMIVQVRSRVAACYDAALAEQTGLTGELKFEVGVGETGAVTASVVADDPGLRDAGVTGCVLQVIRRTSFAPNPPEGGEVVVQFGLRFEPRD